MKNFKFIGIFILLIILSSTLALIFSRVSNNDEQAQEEIPAEELLPTDDTISYLGGKAFVQDIIVLDDFSENQLLDGQIILTGRATGALAFEGDYPIHIEDVLGNVIAGGVAQFIGEWMTSELVPFRSVLHVVYTGSDAIGKLVIENSNPSGLPGNGQRFEIPITLTPSQETMTTFVYFPNSNRGSNEDCSKVFSVERTIPKTTAVGRSSLYELLKGPTTIERNQGFSTAINPSVELLNLAVGDSTAYADFSSNLNTSGSCMVTAIRAQIEQTLKQFPTVREVTIAVEGDSATALQP